MDNASTIHGLTLLRASRLESLLDPLAMLLKQTQPDKVLQPQRVVAAHPGMKQWLTGALAKKLGAGRIVANLEVILPSAWLDGLSGSLLGAQAVALPRYRREHLRWTLHAMLKEPATLGVVDQRLIDYLQGGNSADERALRRFQLADRLARVLSQYLVYRGDWLAAWEAGKTCFATAQCKDAALQALQALQALESQCLAPLWRAVVAKLGAHRGRLVGDLVKALDAAHDALAPLHVFGLSHLPPAELAALHAYARQAPVFLYAPDPCREYWGGLHAARGVDAWRTPDAAVWQSFRKEEGERLADADALDWREQGHPLLARWGRMGQHFFAALVEGEVREDIRHWQDEVTTAPRNRLERVQESIRQLDPALMGEDAKAADAPSDASLRIHACHTRQRELEVLRDALLDAIEHEGIAPGEIVVMSPDIQDYLPQILAVFGEPGSTRERLLPYHLADVPVARSHALFSVFEVLLGLGASRITAPEVVDLLGVAEVRRALALDDESADVLVEWLRSSRVAWALDGQHKAALSLPARSQYSFAWAMDRMLAGYLMADVPGTHDAQAVQLPDGVQLLPMAGIEGPASAALGSLDRLLCELQEWRDLAQVEQSASAWATALRARVDALLQADAGDADACAALSVLHRAIASLATEPERNEEDPVLRLSVVRELMRDALAAAPERQRFLMGGITFCGMVPQRAIPFQMVCVLGLNEGAFPRNPSDGGVDLMPRLRRMGDRDAPGDDRYLFLETLMSARRRLHLSYIGQGVRDGKSRNPAAPLAELIAELERYAAIAPGDEKTPRPWLVRHPLQPFDARYFDGKNPALYSYSSAFARMQGDGRGRLPSLRDGALPASAPLPDPLPLNALEGYFKDPARALLRDHLKVSLDALDADARLPEIEPMDGISSLHSVASSVFLRQVLPRMCADAAWAWDRTPPDWVQHGGLLPLGKAGREAWKNEADAVEALCAAAAASARFDGRGALGGKAVRVEVSLAGTALEPDAAASAHGLRITGIVPDVFPLHGTEHGVQVVRAYPDTSTSSNKKHGLKKPEDLGFRQRVPAFLHWALLRLQHDETAPVKLTMLAQKEPDMAELVNAWDARFCEADPATRLNLADDLRRRVCALAELWQKGRDGLSHFYPKAGWKGVQAKPEAAAILSAVSTAWASDFGSGERDYAPGYTRMLEGEMRFGDPQTDPDGQALQALMRDAHKINELILLQTPAPESPEDASEAAA